MILAWGARVLSILALNVFFLLLFDSILTIYYLYHERLKGYQDNNLPNPKLQADSCKPIILKHGLIYSKTDFRTSQTILS